MLKASFYIHKQQLWKELTPMEWNKKTAIKRGLLERCPLILVEVQNG